MQLAMYEALGPMHEIEENCSKSEEMTAFRSGSDQKRLRRSSIRVS